MTSVAQASRARVLPESDEAYREVARALAEGALVGIPGVSNYSVIADARSDEAVARVYRLKNRPASKPLTLMMPPHDAAHWIVVHDDCRSALSLLGEPIVLVGRMRSSLPLSARVSAGTGKLGVFWLATRLHRLVYHHTSRAEVPIAGTSLNLSGEPMAVTFEEALGRFGGALDVLVDGGDCIAAGQQATVLDVSDAVPRVLREGFVGSGVVRAMFPAVQGA